MQRFSLEKLAIEAEKTHQLQIIRDATVKLDELNEQLKDFYRRKFSEHYNGANAEDIYDSYGKRLAECCYQGGEGYEWWLPNKGYPYTDKYKPSYTHCVISPGKYKEAQPTQQERDAYFVVHEKEMKVTETPHREVWGN